LEERSLEATTVLKAKDTLTPEALKEATDSLLGPWTLFVDDLTRVIASRVGFSALSESGHDTEGIYENIHTVLSGMMAAYVDEWTRKHLTDLNEQSEKIQTSCSTKQPY
jgi:hypothetical protein